MILLVDDDPRTLQALVRMLSPRLAVTALTITGGLEVAKSRHPSVVLLDIYLGMENGIDAIRDFKRLAPVIAMTAYAAPQVLRQALDEGAIATIQKENFIEVFCVLDALTEMRRVPGVH